MARLFKTGVTAEGDVITGGKLQSTASAGDEGGEIFLSKSVTNTTLNGGVTIDVFQNKLRFFEQGGTARGFYIDMSTGGAGVATNLVSGGSYTLPAATATALGGIELFSATTQTTAANAVTTTASRTYGLQLNADLQGVVNVPWTDTNTFPTTWTYTDGTTAGPTASITGTSSTISVAAIPSASATVSGIVTTGTQTFAGTKTLTAPTIDVINAASASSTTADLFGNVTTGTVGIADSLTTGTLNIGNGTTSSTGRTVNINTNASGSITVTTNIGSNVLGGTINLYSGAGNINLVNGGTITTPNVTSANSGSITIATGQTTTSGNSGSISIDTGVAVGTAGAITIGNTRASALTIGRTGVTTTVNGTLVGTLGKKVIQTIALSGTSAISFTSIPSGYRDLEVRILATTAVSTSAQLTMTVNSLTTTIYATVHQYVNGVSPSTIVYSQQTGSTSANLSAPVSFGATASSSLTYVLNDYTSGSFKNGTVVWMGGPSSGTYYHGTGGIFLKTTAAITQIDIAVSGTGGITGSAVLIGVY